MSFAEVFRNAVRQDNTESFAASLDFVRETAQTGAPVERDVFDAIVDIALDQSLLPAFRNKAFGTLRPVIQNQPDFADLELVARLAGAHYAEGPCTYKARSLSKFIGKRLPQTGLTVQPSPSGLSPSIPS